ncbi:hypothetical protein [Brunnivagina elsteri]|uniref:Uncharacterized protein n=1 Tax=Brunnivagina elsteri CCALA 953 TaxID=987040 RepID=A0A2A2TEG4_9CYAN|nr:hypothetical protein [Calothrix elsteri]PAX51799.1 hypothetical protein CK510_22835 [Calothrix elsteri CCALA 953]
MSHHLPETKIPAPCIINTGVIVSKLDMRRLLTDLSRVHYVYIFDGTVQSEGDGDVMEVFANPQRSTLVANHTLYLNVCSFDYLELQQTPEKETHFDLVQEGWRLRLIPLSTPSQERRGTINVTAIEAMMEQVLSARWDAEFDDDSSEMF